MHQNPTIVFHESNLQVALSQFWAGILCGAAIREQRTFSSSDYIPKLFLLPRLVSFGANYLRDTINASEQNSTTTTKNLLNFNASGKGWYAIGTPLSPTAQPETSGRPDQRPQAKRHCLGRRNQPDRRQVSKNPGTIDFLIAARMETGRLKLRRTTSVIKAVKAAGERGSRNGEPLFFTVRAGAPRTC